MPSAPHSSISASEGSFEETLGRATLNGPRSDDPGARALLLWPRCMGSAMAGRGTAKRAFAEPADGCLEEPSTKVGVGRGAENIRLGGGTAGGGVEKMLSGHECWPKGVAGGGTEKTLVCEELPPKRAAGRGTEKTLSVWTPSSVRTAVRGWGRGRGATKGVADLFTWGGGVPRA